MTMKRTDNSGTIGDVYTAEEVQHLIDENGVNPDPAETAALVDAQLATEPPHTLDYHRDVNLAVTKEILRHLPAPALRDGEHVSFRWDGSNVIICEQYDETGLLVTHAYRIWIDAELIEDET